MSKRSVIEFINFEGVRAVRKTFNKGMETYYYREIKAYEKLKQVASFTPNLLCAESNSLIIEHIEHNKSKQPELLKSNLRSVSNIVTSLWRHGYAHLDIHPGNLLVNDGNKLYLIDYEFFYVYRSKPKNLLQSYDLVGMKNFKKWGILGNNPMAFINKTWSDITGFSLSEIVVIHS